ncbi:MAG: YcaO-like family protein [Thermoproteota archaeon]|nr:YcaO-like family protein [Thermoproteota archaeon]
MSNASRLYLKSIKKFIFPDGNISLRVKPASETLHVADPICKKIGVTRISDITYMDKLYIPNYSVFLPGTQDSIWVYSGKGPTKKQAKASGLMETIERYCSLSSNYSKNYTSGSYAELSGIHRKVIHPDEVLEPVNSNYDTISSIVDYVSGYDLQNNHDVLIPAQLAFSKYSAKGSSDYPFIYSHTNGLASGNTLEEAICHALYEVIERDAVSIADLCSSSIPFTELKKNNELIIPEDEFVDDANLFQEVDISQEIYEYEPLKMLVKKFNDAELHLLIKDITQKDIGVPTFVASCVESISSDYGYYAKGYGTHLDTRIALIRAITELSQTRAGNIQGARDDLRKIQYRENDQIHKRKWEFMRSMSSGPQNKDIKQILFSEIETHVIKDILDEIKYILSSLKKAGLKRAIVVDLTDPDLGIPVVRAIVPGLETFEIQKLFTSTEFFMGRRATSYYEKMRSVK